MAFCTWCGGSSQADDRFCRECGERLKPASTGASQEGAPGSLADAVKALAGGDAAGARDLLQAFIALEPDNGPARAYLGLANLRSARVAEARDELVRAVELSPESFICHSKYAEFLAKLGFHDQAVKQLDVALSCGPPDVDSRRAALELRAFCVEHARTIFYRHYSSPAEFKFSNLLPVRKKLQKVGG